MNEQPKTGRPYRPTLEDRAYRLLAEHDEFGQNDMMPLNNRTLKWTSKDGCERVFVFLNDAAEVGIGFPYRWHVILRREDFHKIGRWYVRQWAFGEWFGLRRALWYRLLHRRVERTKREVAHQRDTEGTQPW